MRLYTKFNHNIFKSVYLEVFNVYFDTDLYNYNQILNHYIYDLIILYHIFTIYNLTKFKYYDFN